MKYSDKHFDKRLSEAKQRKSNWDSHLRDAYDLFLPNRQTIDKQPVGSKRNINLFDGTGVNSLQEYANNLKQMLLPSNSIWAELQPGVQFDMDLELGNITQDDIDETSRLLSLVNKAMFRFIWSSNFDHAVHESIQDMAISTGAMMILDTGDAKQPLNFVSVPFNEFFLESDRNVFREHKMPVRELYESFPHAKQDEEIDRILAENPNKEIELCEATIWNSKTKEYDYEVRVKGAKRELFFTDTYEASPWVVFRANLTPGEVMGRGPALNALGDMKSLNKLAYQMLANNDMAINPPLIVNAAAGGLDIGNVNVSPGAVLPVFEDFNGSGQPYSYLQTNASFQAGYNGKQELVNQVERAFQLPQLGSLNDGARSATEVSIRNAQALSQQAAVFGRLNTELVQKIVKRVYSILKNYSEVVVSGIDIDGGIAKIEASSPLAKVQKQKEMEATLNFMNLAMGMGEPGQAMLATTINMNEIGNFLADSMGVPAALKLSLKEREKMQQQMQQAAQQQMQQGVM